MAAHESWGYHVIQTLHLSRQTKSFGKPTSGCVVQNDSIERLQAEDSPRKEEDSASTPSDDRSAEEIKGMLRAATSRRGNVDTSSHTKERDIGSIWNMYQKKQLRPTSNEVQMEGRIPGDEMVTSCFVTNVAQMNIS